MLQIFFNQHHYLAVIFLLLFLLKTGLKILINSFTVIILSPLILTYCLWNCERSVDAFTVSTIYIYSMFRKMKKVSQNSAFVAHVCFCSLYFCENLSIYCFSGFISIHVFTIPSSPIIIFGY